jgi:hypothetical protein
LFYLKENFLHPPFLFLEKRNGPCTVQRENFGLDKKLLAKTPAFRAWRGQSACTSILLPRESKLPSRALNGFDQLLFPRVPLRYALAAAAAGEKGQAFHRPPRIHSKPAYAAAHCRKRAVWRSRQKAGHFHRTDSHDSRMVRLRSKRTQKRLFF